MASAIAGGEFCVSASAQIQSRVPNRFRASIIVALLVAVLAVGFLAFRSVKNAAPAAPRAAGIGDSAAATTSQPLFKLPAGAETYRISQSGTVSPKIVEATIDPPDVHVGDKQTLSVIVQDAAASISFVEGQIQTDHGTSTLVLGLVGPVADAELAPERWVVDSSNHIVQNDRESSFASLGSVAHAAEAPNLKYETSWTVEDTHDTRYHTTFVVRDSAGRENSVTLAWSDACGIPAGGNWSLSSNGDCTISSVDGVDAGNATIDSYSLTLNSTFAFNPGQSISVTNGGSIAIGSRGQLKKTYLWVHDVDGDGYPGPDQLAQDTNPGGYSRRYAGNPIDCNDSNATVYQNRTVFPDNDRDGYIAVSGSTQCVGNAILDGESCPDVNGNRSSLNLTYYFTSDGAEWLDALSVLGFDANDANPCIH